MISVAKGFRQSPVCVVERCHRELGLPMISWKSFGNAAHDSHCICHVLILPIILGQLMFDMSDESEGIWPPHDGAAKHGSFNFKVILTKYICEG